MKRFLLIFMMLIWLAVGAGAASAESLKLGEAVELLESWNKNAESLLIREGWVYAAFRQQMSEETEGWVMPYDYVEETWTHFNADHVRDIEIVYYRSKEDGRKLWAAAIDGFLYVYKDKTLFEKHEVSRLSTDFDFALDLRSKVDEGSGYEIQVVDDVIGDTKAVRLDTLTYFSSFEKKALDDLMGLNTLGEFYRRWYDPETGFLLGFDRYYMTEDRELVYRSSISGMVFRTVDELPETVREDCERTRRREFEETDLFKIVSPDGDVSYPGEMN